MGTGDHLIRRLRASLPFRDDAGSAVWFLAGSGRSGTTWIGEVLAPRLGARFVFEPFRPGVVRETSALLNRQYMRPGQAYPALEPAIDRVISGQFRSSWSDRYNNRFVYQSRLVKEIRTNLMLGWLAKRYPGLKIVLVLRDPYAVTLSQSTGGWKLSLQKFLDQPELVEDFLDTHLDLILAAKSPAEKAIVHWIIENYVPLRQQALGLIPGASLRTFSYESLRDDPEAMLALLDYCGLSVDEEIRADSKKPSRVSRGRTRFGSVDVQAALSQTELTFARRALEAFGMDCWVRS